MDKYVSFKHLLEYFVAHLSWVQNEQTDGPGYTEYIKPLIESNSFKSSGQGYKGAKIQQGIKQWESYPEGKICININPTNYTSRGCYLHWISTGINIIARWDNNKIKALGLVEYYDDSEWSEVLNEYPLDSLGLFDGTTEFNQVVVDLFSKFSELLKKWRVMTNTKYYIDILKSNYNLVLTGAPGTGKTYLAKQIARAMGCSEDEVGFVQFHPSYDYTDFVEGLRPIEDDNGNVVFERKDGVFKEFCAKALDNLQNSQKSLQTLQEEVSVRDLVEDFIQDAIESDALFETKGTKNVFHIIDNRAKTITIEIPRNEKTRVISLPKSDLITLLENKVAISGSKEIQVYFNRKYRTQQDSYTYVLYDKLKTKKSNNKATSVSLVPKKDFVFIIDEINRGELSKIFGELFFAIDPGYRGEKGRIKTQYQNLVEAGDSFDKGFYVPENVYIIGTMNDIDRGVESMDFAIRRRFAWLDVKVEDRVSMLDEQIPDWSEAAKRSMISLNAALKEKSIGLTSAYDIGPAYFIKIELYDGDFEKLWGYHIKGILAEYLRGTRGIEEKVATLKEAFDAYKE